jgi:hypothetical protein
MAEHAFTLFAHTSREHASTSTQLVAKPQRLTLPFSSLPVPMVYNNLRRGCAQTKIRMATWQGI